MMFKVQYLQHLVFWYNKINLFSMNLKQKTKIPVWTYFGLKIEKGRFKAEDVAVL